MSDALSFAEIAEQRAELLPERTVMSMFNASWWGDCDCDDGGFTLLDLDILNISIL